METTSCACWLSGIRQTTGRHWSLPHMALLKKWIKYRIMKLNAQRTSGKNISMLKNKHMAKTAIKSYSLGELKDKHIGKKGTPAREKYEYELSMDVLGHMIKKARQERHLT